VCSQQSQVSFAVSQDPSDIEFGEDSLVGFRTPIQATINPPQPLPQSFSAEGVSSDSSSPLPSDGLNGMSYS